ncbi:MAG: NAD(P)H-dependent oxidoreductase [Clostridia bacterium]|nr:NAD(P)H-dependent oxidoreductase [Clostridia bacterium]
MARNLIIYYSRAGENYFGGEIKNLEKGNTELVAEYIRDAADGETFKIEPAEDYPADYNETAKKAKAELKAGARPALKAYLSDISGFDNIFVCGPCWWGTYPCVVFSLLERLDWKGKRVFPVITHEGSGLGSAPKDLKKICRGAKIEKGLAVEGKSAAEASDEVKAWAKAQI